MKKKIFSVMCCTLVATFVLNPSVSFANSENSEETVQIESTQRQEIETNFDRAGIPLETQEELFNKMESGEVLDANNPAAEPIHTEEYTYVDENGQTAWTSRETYSDGSVTQYTISGGDYTAGSGYATWTGRTVSMIQGAGYSEFKADYTHVNGGYDQIGNVYEWSVSGVGDLSNISLELVQPKENASGDAYAYLRFTGSIPGYTGTFYNRLYVGNDTAYNTQ